MFWIVRASLSLGFRKSCQIRLRRQETQAERNLKFPFSEAVKKNIEKTLLEKDQFFTHVDLIVGMDDDFVSAHFSNVR